MLSIPRMPEFLVVPVGAEDPLLVEAVSQYIGNRLLVSAMPYIISLFMWHTNTLYL